MDKKDFYKKFGDILKATRTQRKDKMSQYKLAELSGLTRHTIQMVENGRQGITLHALFVWAKALEVPLAKLAKDLDYSMEYNRLPDAIFETLSVKKAGRPKIKKKIELT